MTPSSEGIPANAGAISGDEVVVLLSHNVSVTPDLLRFVCVFVVAAGGEAAEGAVRSRGKRTPAQGSGRVLEERACAKAVRVAAAAATASRGNETSGVASWFLPRPFLLWKIGCLSTWRHQPYQLVTKNAIL